MIRAATDPAARPDFYRELRRSTLYVLTPEPPATEASRTLEKGTSLSLVQWQGTSGLFTPIFSSRGRIDEVARRSGHAEAFLGIEGAALFGMLTQHPEGAILNPGLAYGKELTASEIHGLADGSILQKGEERVLKKATSVLLGQPAVYPSRLVDGLKRLFGQRDSVEAAYLAQVVFEGGEQGPHPIVGLLSTNYPKDVEDAAMVAQEIADQLPVDFVDLRGQPEGGFADYFRDKTKPFFERKKRKPWWKLL